MKKIISLMMVMVMLLSFGGGAFAEVGGDYKDLFNKYLNSDGAYSEGTISELADIFLNDPEGFISNMLEFNEKSQERIAFSLCAEFIVRGSEELESFEKIIYSKLDLKTNSKIKNIFDYILKTYESNYDKIATPSINYVGPIDSFDVEAIQNQIRLNELNGENIDEEFAFNMAKNYNIDPILFAKALEKFDRATISNVANNISYAKTMQSISEPYPTLSNSNLEKSNTLEKENKYILDDLNNNEKQIFNFLEGEIQKKGVMQKSIIEDMDFIGEKEVEHDISIMSTQKPVIGDILYKGNIEAGKNANLSVIFQETTAKNLNRTYFAKVYCIRDGVTYLKSTKSFTIPSGKSETIENFSIVFSHAGSFYTKVEVYSSPNGSLLTSRTGKNPDISKGDWKIKVSLFKDRYKVGKYYLYNAGGDLVQSGDALGRSASNASMSTFEGNTPIGNYTGYLGSVQSNTESYGTYKVIVMDGDNNYYVPRYRSGIWIHGGRSQTTLSPTHGCVRIFNNDQKRLQDNITELTKTANGHNKIGKINITE